MLTSYCQEAEVLNDSDSAIGVTDDELSTVSLRSSIREYHNINGRGYHRDEKYYLPSDEHESERLDLQDHQLRLTFGGKRYFAPNAEAAKRVLDVGTGTGVWAIEFADDHPHAEVFGIDIAAIQPTFVPPNCVFEIDDAEKEWTWKQKFDYIFVRLMVGSIADWDNFTKQCFDNLEPGGWLEVIDPTFPAKSDDGTLELNSPLNIWDELTSKGAARLGRPFDEGVNHEKRLIEQGFINVTKRAFKWPTNTWPRDPKYKEIGLWTLANIERNLESISTILLAHGLGMTQEEILVFITQVRAEMRNPRVHAYWEVPGWETIVSPVLANFLLRLSLVGWEVMTQKKYHTRHGPNFLNPLFPPNFFPFCLAISTALAITIVRLGFGKDISEIAPALLPNLNLVGAIYGIFIVLSASWSKTSFAVTLLRLVDGWMKWLLWLMIVTMNIAMGLVVIFSFVKCTPTRRVWDSQSPGTCWTPDVAAYFNIFAGAFTGLIDLGLCVLAWIIIWRLSMRKREKAGVGIALTFGVFAAAAAGAKCYGLLGLKSENRTEARVGLVIWGNVECAVTIMAASIPVMRILLLRVCSGDPSQGSIRPLRELRLITTWDKRPSVNAMVPDGTQTSGARAGEQYLDDVSLSRTVSSGWNNIAMWSYNILLTILAVANGVVSSPSSHCPPFPSSMVEFSSGFVEPKPPVIKSQYKAHFVQHKWNANLSHIAAGFIENSPSEKFVRVDAATDGEMISSYFNYANVTKEGLVDNTLTTYDHNGSQPNIWRDYVNSNFPAFNKNILVEAGATFEGLVKRDFVPSAVAAWSIMYQGAVPVTVYVNECHIVVGYDYFAPELRTRVIMKFFNIHAE
ncbi:hypothetical protein FGRMN_4939 [Fusarium graminum]|nr:hypothetical protein FGRMN_4939 [Fusarium graminum]